MNRFFLLLLLFALSLGRVDGATLDQKLAEVNREFASHERFLSERVLAFSHFQDALVEELDGQKSEEDFLFALRSAEQEIDEMKGNSNEIYGRLFSHVNPQRVTLADGRKLYLNTFKTGRHLTSEERRRYFAQEWSDYQRDKVALPFELNHKSLPRLEEEKIYNFVLLPNGEIRAALEKPNGNQYHARDYESQTRIFSHPNHTILAAHPDQGVLAAGAMILYQNGDKRLLFLSNKTGHFEVLPESLEAMVEALIALGFEREALIPLMDVDFGKLAYSFKRVKLDVGIRKKEARRFFDYAQEEFLELHDLTRTVKALEHLLIGREISVEEELWLRSYRKSAQRLLNAFNLFDRQHQAPKPLRTLTKRLGKMLDALRVGVPVAVSKQSEKLLNLLYVGDPADALKEFHPAERKSIELYLRGLADRIDSRVEWLELDISEYHELKKEVRELGTLLYLFTLDHRDYHLSRHAAKVLYSLNDEMAKEHDAYIERTLQQKVRAREMVPLPDDLVRKIQKATDKLLY